MDINQLITPEGLNRYLNQEIRTLPVKVPDFLLQMFLWQKVKFDFTYNDEIAEKLFEDNGKHLLVIKTNEVTTMLMIGYLHIPDDIHINSTTYSKVISEKAENLVNKLNKVAVENKWNHNQIFIISTFRLTSYSKIDLSKFPNKAIYFYLADSADPKDKFYELTLDKNANEFMEGNIMLKNLLKRGK